MKKEGREECAGRAGSLKQCGLGRAACSDGGKGRRVSARDLSSWSSWKKQEGRKKMFVKGSRCREFMGSELDGEEGKRREPQTVGWDGRTPVPGECFVQPGASSWLFFHRTYRS